MAGKAPLSDVRFLTVAEVALIMRVSKMTVYHLVHSGELESIRVGRSFRIPEAAVSQYLRAAFLGDQPDMPVRIYLAAGIDPDLVDSAVSGLLDAFRFQVERTEVPIIGSWYSQFWVRAKSASLPMEEQLIKLQRAIELAGLDRPQSEVDLNQADAVARLLGALDPENDALMQIGSLVLIKVNSKVFVRTLTQAELVYFNRNPALFQDPAKALQVLQQGRPEKPPPPIAADG